jgi:4-alpha-glucanotransferase
MAVLQFAFDGRPRNEHHPRNVARDTVIYTGTHDTDTAVGWWHAADEETRACADLDEREPHWSLIELALRSRADVAIVQAQDVLGLDSDARMNRPGEETGNWRWRLRPGQLDSESAGRLRSLTQASHRSPR